MATNGTPEQSNDAPQRGGPLGSGFSVSGKTLSIAGGGAAALVVVIVVVVLFATGAFGGGGGGASGGGNWLGYVPADAAGVGVADSRAFFGGDVPEDFVEYIDDGDGGESEKTYDFVDVDEDDLIIHASAFDANLDTTLEILQGSFDFDVIREELEDGRDCEDDDYRGFELWECLGQQYPAVALFEKDKYVVLAAQRQEDLEDVLTYKSRDTDKLASADDSDIRRLVGHTDGWMQLVLLGDFCLVDRCEGLAFALGQSDDSADMPASYALLFTSERAAAAAEGDIEIDDLLQKFYSGFDVDLDIGEVKADGEFVLGSGKAEFVDPSNARSRSAGSRGGSDGGSTSNVGVSSGSAVQAQASAPPTAVPVAMFPTNTPVPAPPGMSTGSNANLESAVSRSEWIDDCTDDTVRVANREGSVRPDQRDEHAAETVRNCECTYDYFAEYWRPDPPMFSAVTNSRLDASAMTEYFEMSQHARSFCQGR